MNVLVTGVSRGIGAGLFAAYARRGDDVWGTVRTAGGERRLTVDLREPASIATAARTFGDRPLDLLVVSAGIYPDGRQRLEGGYPPALWAETFAVNVTGAFLTVQAFLPALRRAKGAKIAFLASQMGSTTRAPGGSYIYRASKAALINLGRNLATDLRGEGIAVGIYHPGWVKTDMGGAGAEISVEQSVAGLIDRFDRLSPATSGIFETWDGRPIPY